ncbi:MAG: hypothetical protein ACTHMU_15135, partial [Thermomicrobiales bacterium]
MARSLRITRLTVRQYEYELPDMGYDYNGFNNVYQPGARSRAGGYIFTIETNEGVTGEYAGGNSVS